MEVTINYWVVLGATVFSMVLGSVWYSLPVFGRKWMMLSGMTEEKAKQGAGAAMGGMLVVAFVMALVLAHFVDYVGATTKMDWWTGAVTGFWAWLGFVATVGMSNVLFEKRPLMLFVINAGYQLVNMIVAGAMLGMWQ